MSQYQYKYNPISGTLDLVTVAGNQVWGYVANYTALSLGVTSSDPQIGDLVGALTSQGVYPVNFRDKGFYLRISMTGVASVDYGTSPYAGFPNTASQVSVDAGLISDQYVSPLTFENAAKWNTKENTITPGTTAQYWRGDKTFQTLDTSVVPENGNLYFTNTRFDTRFATKTTTDLAEGINLYYTNARGIASTLTGYIASPGVITAADSILSAIQKIDGNISGNTNFNDSVFYLYNNATPSKHLAFSAASITAATTRTLTAIDADYIIAGSTVALTSGRVPFITTGGLLIDDTSFTYTSNQLNLAGIPGTDLLNISLNSNPANQMMLGAKIQNLSAGTSSGSQLGIFNNISTSGKLFITSSTFTTSGLQTSNQFNIITDSSGLLIANTVGIGGSIVFSMNGIASANEVFSMDSSTLHLIKGGRAITKWYNGGFALTLQSSTLMGANYTMTWPTSNSTGSQALVNDGAGLLSWVTLTTGTVTSVTGTVNRITSTGGSVPVIDISATFEALLGKVANPLSQFAATTSAQLASVISDETGGGGVLVFNALPTFTTQITTPKIYGGTGVTDKVDFVSTSGNGTLTSVAFEFWGANNGANTLIQVLNNGSTTMTATGNVEALALVVSNNTSLGMTIKNNTTNTAAAAKLSLLNTGNIGPIISVTSSSFITAGLIVANQSRWISNATNGSLFAETNNSTGKFIFSVGGTAATNELMRITLTGIAVNGLTGATKITVPSAYMHFAAGLATAGTAPIKLTGGTNNTTAETGAIEYNSTNLFFTRTGTTRESVFVGNDGATAPTTTIGVAIVNYYGSSATNFLGTPNSWASVVIAGTTYKIPLYT